MTLSGNSLKERLFLLSLPLQLPPAGSGGRRALSRTPAEYGNAREEFSRRGFPPQCRGNPCTVAVPPATLVSGQPLPAATLKCFGD